MIIKVKVKTSSVESGIEEIIKDKEYIICVKARAENNEANFEAIKIVSKYFKTPTSNIKIKTGLKNRNKLVEIK
ncbi:MAG: DUF167 domain-containing protein [Nanoarchaeota archaeon]